MNMYWVKKLKDFILIFFSLSFIIFVLTPSRCHCQFYPSPPSLYSSARNLYDQFYQTVDSTYDCVLLMNETSYLGCKGTLSESGDVSVLYPVQSHSELEDFLNNLKHINEKFALVLSSRNIIENLEMLSVLSDLDSSFLPFKKRITGTFIIYFNNESISSTESFSPELPFPNYEYGIQFERDAHRWNDRGNGLLFSNNFNFPVIWVPLISPFDDTTEKNTALELLQKSVSNQASNYEFPQYVAEFQYFMQSSSFSNSYQCIEASTCQPIGGHSVWTLISKSKQDALESQRPLIMITSQMDTISLFHKASIGAVAHQASVIAEITAAEALLKSASELDFDIMFVFFEAESFGYSGSQKFWEDITNFTCIKKAEETSREDCLDPYKPSTMFNKLNIQKRLRMVIEIGQIGTAGNEPDEIFMHPLTVLSTNTQKSIEESASQSGVVLKNSSTPLIPPSSLHTFHFYQSSLRRDTNDISPIESFLLTDFDQIYKNRFYHSELDNIHNLDMKSVCKVSSMIANMIAKISSFSGQGESFPVIDINCTFAEELSHCLLQNMNCALNDMKHTTEELIPPSHYSGVYQGLKKSQTSQFIYQLMASMSTFEKQESSYCEQDDDCDRHYYCIQSKCSKSNTFTHDALSPAFKYDYEQWKWVILGNYTSKRFENGESLRFSLFTESNWNFLGVRIYQRDSTTTHMLILVMGIGITIISLSITSMRFIFEYKVKQI